MNILSSTAHRFLQHGHRPATDRARSALLDELRSALSANITAWTPPTDAAGLDRIQRSSEAAKAVREKAGVELDRRIAEQREKLRRQGTSKAKPSAKAPAPAGPYQKESTQNIVLCLNRGYLTSQQAIDAAAELAKRGVVIGTAGYSISKP